MAFCEAFFIVISDATDRIAAVSEVQAGVSTSGNGYASEYVAEMGYASSALNVSSAAQSSAPLQARRSRRKSKAREEEATAAAAQAAAAAAAAADSAVQVSHNFSKTLQDSSCENFICPTMVYVLYSWTLCLRVESRA